jgi:Plasmid pRiA4b ORF-3-like protein
VPRQILQLLVTLDGVSPPVWRRLLLPGGFTLDRLHRCLQLVMGWHDCHLHSFDINGIQYGEPDPGEELSVRDEMDTRLDRVASKGTQFRYTYDYGDWWEHTVKVEAVVNADPDERYPLCLEGEGECPPEDTGGVYRYAQLREAVGDPRHPEHLQARDLLERVGTDRFRSEIATILLRRMA